MTTQITSPLTGTWDVDPVHSSFGFAVRYQGISLYKGSFSEVAASLKDTGHGLHLHGTAPVSSISIVSPQMFRDHVLSDDFFAADAYPTISFESEDISLHEDGSATVQGILTIKGLSKEVQATGHYEPAGVDAFGNTRAALRLETVIDRTEFGINWNMPLPSGGDALAKQVTIIVELALVQEAA